MKRSVFWGDQTGDVLECAPAGGGAETGNDCLFRQEVCVTRNDSLTADVSAEKKFEKSAPKSSTKEARSSINVDNSVEDVFCAAKTEDFEDGMESQFEKALRLLILTYGGQALSIALPLILYKSCSQEVAAQALRCIGSIDHIPTLNFRLWMLARCLSNPSAIIRDGALIGISFTNDKFFLPYLEKALTAETHKGLRKDLEKRIKRIEQIS